MSGYRLRNWGYCFKGDTEYVGKKKLKLCSFLARTHTSLSTSYCVCLMRSNVKAPLWKKCLSPSDILTLFHIFQYLAMMLSLSDIEDYEASPLTYDTICQHFSDLFWKCAVLGMGLFTLLWQECSFLVLARWRKIMIKICVPIVVYWKKWRYFLLYYIERTEDIGKILS